MIDYDSYVTIDDLNKVNDLSDKLNYIVDDIVNKYSEPLDNYVKKVNTLLRSEKDISETDLEDIVLNLSTVLYFAQTGQERLGIKEDVSKMIRAEVYNSCYADSKGTTAQKSSIAFLESKQEAIIAAIYQRAYKGLKARVDAGLEVLNSVKKVLTLRITSYSTEYNKTVLSQYVK